MIISFDLDGVLMKNPFRDGVFPEIIRILKEQYLIVYSYQTDLENIEKLIWDKMIAEHTKRLQKDMSYLAYDWDEIIQSVADEMGCPGDINVRELVLKYCHHPFIMYYDQPQSLFKWLKQNGVQLVIITNGYYKYQYPVLRALGLNQYFERIITPDQTRKIKPDKEIFQEAFQGDKICYHVGDTIIDDVYGAKRAGAIPIWINRDLPDSLISLNPAERIEAKESKEFILTSFQQELVLRKGFKGLSFKEIRPSYIISALEELEQINNRL